MSRTRMTVALAGTAALAVAFCWLSRWAWPGLASWADLRQLPDDGRAAVGFLLLLPVAATVVCVARNLIGLPAFGTFTPAVLGLALWQTGFLIGVALLSLVLIPAWWFRGRLEPLHLLQVPRSSAVLSMICGVLVAGLFAADKLDLTGNRLVGLLPLVILIGMAERFWTTAEEDTAGSAARALCGTLVTAAAAALAVGIPGLAGLLLARPELLALVLAAQLLIGRYTGYRLSELWRFREAANWGCDETIAARGTLAGRVRADRHEPAQRRVHQRPQRPGVAGERR